MQRQGQQKQLIQQNLITINNEWKPYSHNGSGQRLAYGNGEIYIYGLISNGWLLLMLLMVHLKILKIHYSHIL